MVTFIKGNLFESSAQVLTNPINCVGAMGKGLSKVFAEKYPEMERDYKTRCKNGEVKIGMPYLWEDDRHQVLNFPTKNHWREPSKLDDVREGLEYLAQNYDDMGVGTVAIPALGCGLGGLNWEEVKPLIQEVLGPISDLHAFVYEPTDVGSSQVKGDKDQERKSNGSDGDIAASPL